MREKSLFHSLHRSLISVAGIREALRCCFLLEAARFDRGTRSDIEDRSVGGVVVPVRSVKKCKDRDEIPTTVNLLVSMRRGGPHAIWSRGLSGRTNTPHVCSNLD